MEEYIILNADDFHRLAEVINEHMKCGYTPIGGVAVRHGSSYGAMYLQAMIQNVTPITKQEG